MKRLLLIPFLLALFALNLRPQAACCSLVISGSAASVPISTSSTPVVWIQLVAPTGNASVAYWCDGCTAATATGGILPAGSGQLLPPKGRGGYDLAKVYVYVAMGDTLRVTWDQE